jgi:predicted nucleotidyltransferase
MRRAEVIRRLRRNRSGLQQLGVSRLALYGSTARDSARPDSDVDVVVDASDGRALGLFRLARVAEELERILDRRVDVISRAGLNHAVELKTRVAGDLLDVF